MLDVLRASSQHGWLAACSLHVMPFPYSDIASASLLEPKAMIDSALPCDALMGHCSLCKLRSGLSELSHVGGKVSQAGVRRCIFCEHLMRVPFKHALSDCPISADPGLPSCWTSMDAAQKAFAFCDLPAECRSFR